MLALILVVVFVITYSLYIVPKTDSLQNFHKQCIISNSRYKIVRGNNYYINDTTSEDKKMLEYCLCTQWNLLHILLFIFLTIIYPKYIILFWICGVLFEVFEYLFFECHDYLDIFYNTLGILIGLSFIKIFDF